MGIYFIGLSAVSLSVTFYGLVLDVCSHSVQERHRLVSMVSIRFENIIKGGGECQKSTIWPKSSVIEYLAGHTVVLGLSPGEFMCFHLM